MAVTTFTTSDSENTIKTQIEAASDGDVFIFSSGTYVFTSSIATVKANTITIKGQSTDASAATLIGTTGQSYDISVGTGANTHGFRLGSGIANFVYQDLNLMNFRRLIYAKSGKVQSATIQNSYFRECQEAIHVRGDWTYQDTGGSQGAASAPAADGSKHWLVANNQFTGFAGKCVRFDFGCETITIKNNIWDGGGATYDTLTAGQNAIRIGNTPGTRDTGITIINPRMRNCLNRLGAGTGDTEGDGLVTERHTAGVVRQSGISFASGTSLCYGLNCSDSAMDNKGEWQVGTTGGQGMVASHCFHAFKSYAHSGKPLHLINCLAINGELNGNSGEPRLMQAYGNVTAERCTFWNYLTATSTRRAKMFKIDSEFGDSSATVRLTSCIYGWNNTGSTNHLSGVNTDPGTTFQTGASSNFWTNQSGSTAPAASGTNPAFTVSALANFVGGSSSWNSTEFSDTVGFFWTAPPATSGTGGAPSATSQATTIGGMTFAGITLA